MAVIRMTIKIIMIINFRIIDKTLDCTGLALAFEVFGPLNDVVSLSSTVSIKNGCSDELRIEFY
jgi:hypothetical protein